MNYLKEIIAFNNYARDNGFSAGQRALWYALMAINNRCGWKEWFAAPLLALMNECGLSEEGVKKTRSILIEHGLIEYRSNGRNAPSYKMKSLLSYAETGEIGAQIDTQDGTPTSTPISTPISTPNSTPNSTPISSTLNKQNKRKQNKTILYNNARKSKFNNYEETCKIDYAALEEQILDNMLAEVD